MEKIKLVHVTEDYKDEVIEYKIDFLLKDESMDGSGGLRYCETFEDWQVLIEKNSNPLTVETDKVPAWTFLAVTERDQRLIGMIDIRHELSDHLLKYGGHIGYSVISHERRKGFAKQILALGLEKCKDLKMDKVLLTCHKNNIASKKTIISNKGVLENEVQYEDVKLQRYWITIS